MEEHILKNEHISENYPTSPRLPPPPTLEPPLLLPPLPPPTLEPPTIYKPHIQIDGTKLYYTMHNTFGTGYIITSISNYPIELNSKISDIVKLLKPLYSSSKVKFSNVCGINAENVCSTLSKPGGVKFGILFIYEFIFPRNEVNIAKIEPIYGSSNASIGASYHALSYTEIEIDGNTLHVAIDTTICPFIQFYVGNTIEELTTLICERYQCIKFYITFDCNNWYFEFSKHYTILGRGKGKKYKKYQKNKSHKTKWMRRKTYKIFKKKNKLSKKRSL
jgi:hypothetical protein